MKIENTKCFLLLFIAIVVPCLVSAADFKITNKTTGTINVKTIPSKYEHIELNNKAESVCTPELDDDFFGIIIAAPTKVIVDGEYILPICGSWQFSLKFSNQFNDVSNEIIIVAVDSKTKQSYSSNLIKKGFTPPQTRKWEGTEKELEENTEGGWFNIDIYRYVLKLPHTPATYTIFATIGDVKSNVVEVEVSQ